MSMLVAKGVIGEKSPHLESFLSCTLNESSPVSKLRGNIHVLKYIWTLVCEEWWDLHIARFPCSKEIPDLTLPWKKRVPRQMEPGSEEDDNYRYPDYRLYPESRQACAGCAVATIAKNVTFPKPAIVPPGTFQGQESEQLYVNMLPFQPLDLKSVPPVCRGYLPMIEACLKMFSHRHRDGQKCAYLTIDERSVVDGQSQRRPGLHVESPGVLPVQAQVDAPFRIALPGGRYTPGAEHYWGQGMMMRDERVEGGIFMASNIANTTAVWNCHINNDNGGFVGPHGDIEHLRPLLGPCARTLEAGELVWMTDRTPHESLPVPVGVRRQYFRLVVGTVSAWFSDHSTRNPLGFTPEAGTRVVRGNKFDLTASAGVHFSWHCGTTAQVSAAREFRAVQELLYQYGLGHRIKRAFEYGVVSLVRLCELHRLQVHNKLAGYELWGAEYSASGDLVLFEDHGDHYYDRRQMKLVLKAAREMLGLARPDDGDEEDY